MAYPSTRGRGHDLSTDEAIAALTERFDQFGQSAREAGNSVSNAIDDGRRQVRNVAGESYRDIRHHTQEGVENVSHRIEKNPLSSVVVALAAGILIGKLL
jgi:ElaB/YqjD/DUF883 family membrane-anchored ribosome-binding protein